AYHRHAVLNPGLDLAEPASPGRFSARRASPRQPFGHRVPTTLVGKPGLETLFIDVPGGFGRQDRPERSTGQAQRRAKARPRRFEKSAPVANIARHILEISLRNHSSPAVAVEDDQVEFIEFYIKQLADRKGDQRQFADRRAVLLLGRTQDREMHEIDRWIGFEDVAPDALAGMRLARH